MLELNHIEKEYDGQPLLIDVSFSVGGDENMCILGPSGAGKSTLLRIIAGLELPEAGEVLWDDKNISDLPPYKRNFGLMFQDYALFPHLNVFENVAFGLRMQHVPSIEIRHRVEQALEMIGMRQFVDRSVADLSGGEKQRIAFARALAPKPKLLMLDEPMGSLDRALRAQLTKELHILLAEMDIPVIYVTHDQEEAFSIADRLLVLHEGKIVQSGTPQFVYSHPKNPWIASFFGLDNLVQGEVISSDPMVVNTGIGNIEISCSQNTFMPGESVHLVVLPTALKIETHTHSPNNFKGEIMDVIFKGTTFALRIKFKSGVELMFEMPHQLPKGSQVACAIDPQAVLCFHTKE